MNKQQHVYDLTKSIADEWAENAESQIKQRVEEILDNKIKELVLKLCGFDLSGGFESNYWRLDHCNGRSGNSPVMNWVVDGARDFLASNIDKVNLTKEEKEKINKDVKEAYLREYRSKMVNSAKTLAKKHADEYVKNAVGQALDGAAESVRLRLMKASV